MDNTPTLPEGDTPIYAVCLSISQYKDAPTVRAVLSSDTEGRRTETIIAWENIPRFTSTDNAGTWLYGMLSKLVEGFDDHQVVAATLEPVRLRRGGISG